jgi:hypothetical protein
MLPASPPDAGYAISRPSGFHCCISPFAITLSPYFATLSITMPPTFLSRHFRFHFSFRHYFIISLFIDITPLRHYFR